MPSRKEATEGTPSETEGAPVTGNQAPLRRLHFRERTGKQTVCLPGPPVRAGLGRGRGWLQSEVHHRLWVTFETSHCTLTHASLHTRNAGMHAHVCTYTHAHVCTHTWAPIHACMCSGTGAHTGTHIQAPLDKVNSVPQNPCSRRTSERGRVGNRASAAVISQNEVTRGEDTHRTRPRDSGRRASGALRAEDALKCRRWRS